MNKLLNGNFGTTIKLLPCDQKVTKSKYGSNLLQNVKYNPEIPSYPSYKCTNPKEGSRYNDTYSGLPTSKETNDSSTTTTNTLKSHWSVSKPYPTSWS